MTNVLINPSFIPEPDFEKKQGIVVPFSGTYREPSVKTPEFLVQPDHEKEPGIDPSKAFFPGDIVTLRSGQSSSASGLDPRGMYRVCNDPYCTGGKLRVHVAGGTTTVDPSELSLRSFAGQSI